VKNNSIFVDIFHSKLDELNRLGYLQEYRILVDGLYILEIFFRRGMWDYRVYKLNEKISSKTFKENK